MYRDLAAIGWILVGLVVAAMLVVALLSARRMAIRRPGGAVACGLRRAADPRSRRGIAAYRVDQLCWFKALGLGLRPIAVFERRALRLVARHPVGLAGDRVPEAGTVVVEFAVGADDETFLLALSHDALTGLLAWLEAAPQHRFGGPPSARRRASRADRRPARWRPDRG